MGPATKTEQISVYLNLILIIFNTFLLIREWMIKFPKNAENLKMRVDGMN